MIREENLKINKVKFRKCILEFSSAAVITAGVDEAVGLHQALP